MLQRRARVAPSLSEAAAALVSRERSLLMILQPDHVNQPCQPQPSIWPQTKRSCADHRRLEAEAAKSRTLMNSMPSRDAGFKHISLSSCGHLPCPVRPKREGEGQRRGRKRHRAALGMVFVFRLLVSSSPLLGFLQPPSPSKRHVDLSFLIACSEGLAAYSMRCLWP